MMKAEVYLSLNEKALEETKQKASQDSDEGGDLVYKNTVIKDLNFELDEKAGNLIVYGPLEAFGSDIGYISLEMPLSVELSLEVVSSMLKRLGKLKTVLEASK